VTKQTEYEADPRYMMVWFSEGQEHVFTSCTFINSNRLGKYDDTFMYISKIKIIGIYTLDCTHRVAENPQPIVGTRYSIADLPDTRHTT
jgi:hypothetical protein